MIEDPDELVEVESDYYRRLETAVTEANNYISSHTEELESKFNKDYDIVSEILDDFIIYEPMDIIHLDSGYYSGFSIYVEDNYTNGLGMFDDMEAKLIEGGLSEVLAQQLIASIKNRVVSEMEDILNEFSYMGLSVLKQGQIEISTREPQEMNESTSEEDEEFLFSDEGFITLAHIPDEEETNVDDSLAVSRLYDSLAAEVEDMNDLIGRDIKRLAEKYEEQMPRVSEVIREIYLGAFEDPISDDYFQCYVIDYSSSGKMFSIAAADVKPVLEDTMSQLEGLGIPEVVAEQFVGIIEQKIKERMNKLLEENEEILVVVEPTDRTSNFSTIKSRRTTI